jgi:pimeloyl-ACP methyl ester carboxylesterase
VSADAVWSERAGDPSHPLVVLVHGSMDRSAGLLRLSRRLDRTYAVVRYDRRGYGRSIDVGPPHTVAANIDDLESLVEAHRRDDRPVLLFGHSFGGNIALGLAARRPELVGTVTIYETPMSWLAAWPGATAGGAAMSAETPAAAAEAFIRRLVGDAAWERLPPSKQDQRRREGEAMVAELADLRRDPPWDPADIPMPVLTIHGEHGRPHHRDAMLRIAEMVADGRCVAVADAGHPGPHTHADAVAAAFVEFNSARGAD